MWRPLFIAAIVIAISGTATAAEYFFSTGDPDARLGAGSRIAGLNQIDIETADDFDLALFTRIDSASIVGLIPTGASASSVDGMSVKIYRVYPLDSNNPPSGHVPTRVNSPSDIALQTRSTGTSSMTYSVSVTGAGFTVANSVINGINPFPNQHTGGEGAAVGNEVQITVAFQPPLTLDAGHYFFVPQVHLVAGNFLWASASKPIVPPGTSFTLDLQSWIRNATLAPDWLRVGTDIVGGSPAPTFNHVFQLIGVDEHIFGNGFEYPVSMLE